jgi:hypothetical protein
VTLSLTLMADCRTLSPPKVQLPFLLGGGIVFGLSALTARSLIKLSVSMNKEKSSVFSALSVALVKFKPLRTILVLALNALITLILWIIVSALSGNHPYLNPETLPSP